jgi:RNA polymerase sigma-70 factor, ECF subfamily
MLLAMASDEDVPSSSHTPPPVPHGAAPRAESDLTLLRAVARGERWALGALYDRHAALLLGIGVRILRSRDEAEDLLHDVFLEVHRHAGEYDAARGSVRTWICVRMRSRALDRLRAPGRAKRRALEDSLPAGGEDFAADSTLLEGGADHDALRVRAALITLSDAQRTVLELGYFRGLSCSEIAEVLAVPVGTVKSRARSALDRLREALAEA